MALSKKYAFVSSECVACGCCMKVCPRQAITVPKGIVAQVNLQACVGCGKCAVACPAEVITILQREAVYEDAKKVV